MRRLTSLAMLIAACASISLAQSTDDYNIFEFFGGYSHNRVDTGIDDNDPQLDDIIDEREGFNGFNAAVTGNINRYVGLKFDVSGHWKRKTFPISTARLDLDSSLFNFLGGVQIKDNSKETRFKPFAHALVGAAHAKVNGDFSSDICAAVVPSPCPSDFEDSDTGFAGAFGGGLDIRANDRIDIRAFQFDYNPTRVFGGGTQHNFRIGVGIVIH
jgi:opacity protein-like surface antigen